MRKGQIHVERSRLKRAKFINQNFGVAAYLNSATEFSVLLKFFATQTTIAAFGARVIRRARNATRLAIAEPMKMIRPPSESFRVAVSRCCHTAPSLMPTGGRGLPAYRIVDPLAQNRDGCIVHEDVELAGKCETTLGVDQGFSGRRSA